MNEVPRSALREAIQDMHGCDSTWVEAVPVTKTFGERLDKLASGATTKQPYARSIVEDVAGQVLDDFILASGLEIKSPEAIQTEGDWQEYREAA